MKYKAVSGIMLTLLVMGMLTLAFGTQTARAEPETKLYVDPAMFGAGPGETFDITVDIENAENVWSWCFSLSWDPTVLELQDAQEGFFLNQSIYQTMFKTYPDNDAGNVTIVCVLLGEPRSSSANGDGTLATVTFYVEDEGYTTLLLYDTELLDYDIIELSHGTEDGYFSTAFPAVVFSYLPEDPSIGCPVTFNASDSYDYDGFIVSYTWDFGDGNITVVSNPVIVHVYVIRGIYLVNLTVTDNDGNRSSRRRYVIVSGMQNIYIRADGSIDPPTAPISTVDNITYTLTGNISSEVHGIIVERNDVVIDGRGYTLQGTGSGNGFSIESINNVTIKSTNVKGFYYGVCLNSTSCVVLSGNNITNNSCGVKIEDSDGNMVTGNKVTYNARDLSGSAGILLANTTNSQVTNNTIADNNNGIDLYRSSNNTISGNMVSNNWWFGNVLLESSSNNNTISRNDIRGGTLAIKIRYSSDNIISENNATNTFHCGIQLSPSDNNKIFGNNITNNEYVGVLLSSSSNNTISGNLMNGNKYGFGVEGSTLSHFTHSIDVSNLVDGKPVYYFVNQKDLVINPTTYPDIGYLALVNCTNAAVRDINLTNNAQGLLLVSTSNSNITNNTITNNYNGIQLYSSSHNNVSKSNIVDNVNGIVLQSNSDYNDVAINNITKNTWGVYLGSSSRNTVSGNNIKANDYGGILLEYSSNNSIDENNMEANDYGGICLSHSANNHIAENNIAGNNLYGIRLSEHSSENSITGNNITNNEYGIWLYPWFNDMNVFSGNNIANNMRGIGLCWSSRNTFFGNIVTNNNVGIYFYSSPFSDNKFYHNNFINNILQVQFETSGDVNFWDDGYPSGGNYWSDHNPPDIYSGPYQNETGSDGIGDEAYVIDEDNTDRYPLIYPYGYVPSPDLNGDGTVNILDVILLANSFGSDPGHPNWNPEADLNKDGIVNIFDAILIAGNFGKTS